ncbi:hypothetical protein [Nannocystis exedens]|nr:hypothetical protein [Nannocystis exedens]
MKRVLGAALLMSSLAGCDEEQLDQRPVDSVEDSTNAAEGLPPLKDGERRINGDVLAEIELDGGADLTFVGTETEDGGYIIHLLEKVPAGAIGLADIPEAHGTNVLDVFWAVTEPGTEVPEQFDLAVPGGAPRGDQGWLLDLMPKLDIVKPRGTCVSNSDFLAELTSKGYTDRGWQVYDEEASTSPYFQYYSEAPHGDWYRYHVTSLGGGHQILDADRYYGLVQLCALGYHPNLTRSGINYPHFGPNVIFMYRQSTTWVSVVNEDLDVADIGAQYYYWSYTLTNYDFGTWIIRSNTNDVWDIGARGEDL